MHSRRSVSRIYRPHELTSFREGKQEDYTCDPEEQEELKQTSRNAAADIITSSSCCYEDSRSSHTTSNSTTATATTTTTITTESESTSSSLLYPIDVFDYHSDMLRQQESFEALFDSAFLFEEDHHPDTLVLAAAPSTESKRTSSAANTSDILTDALKIDDLLKEEDRNEHYSLSPLDKFFFRQEDDEEQQEENDDDDDVQDLLTTSMPPLDDSTILVNQPTSITSMIRPSSSSTCRRELETRIQRMITPIETPLLECTSNTTSHICIETPLLECTSNTTSASSSTTTATRFGEISLQTEQTPFLQCSRSLLQSMKRTIRSQDRIRKEKKKIKLNDTFVDKDVLQELMYCMQDSKKSREKVRQCLLVEQSNNRRCS